MLELSKLAVVPSLLLANADLQFSFQKPYVALTQHGAEAGDRGTIKNVLKWGTKVEKPSTSIQFNQILSLSILMLNSFNLRVPLQLNEIIASKKLWLSVSFLQTSYGCSI
jgi:hypothetical protein